MAKASSKHKQKRKKSFEKKKTQVVTRSAPSPEDLLATKWLTGQKLKDFYKTHGITSPHFEFNLVEITRIKKAITAQWSLERVEELLFVTSKEERAEASRLLTTMTRAAYPRSRSSVSAWAKRHFDPRRGKGEWRQQEVDELQETVHQTGGNISWKEMGKKLGRGEFECKDKWQEIVNRKQKPPLLVMWDGSTYARERHLNPPSFLKCPYWTYTR